MKNLIAFLLLIAVAVTAYVLLDDHFQAEEDSLNSIQYDNIVTKTTPKPSTGSTATGELETASTITAFTANGTEPFWAADFSGSTLAWQSPDLGTITIS
jgi:uncharacterized membrane protein